MRREAAELRIPVMRDGTAIPFSREIRFARDVQRSLLPRKAPRLRTIEFAGLSVPAWGVCGDYFDFLGAGAGRVAIAVGDVSGKGVVAALMMASLQASLRTHYAIGADDLARRLRSVNRLLCESTAPQHFASLFLGEYDELPKKIYCIETGLVNKVGFGFSPNTGKLLENVVFLTIRRTTQDIYYFSSPGGYEVDFYLPETRQLIQVLKT